MIETRRLKNVVIFLQAILSFLLLRKTVNIDDDIQFPVLTPNILIHGKPITIPGE